MCCMCLLVYVCMHLCTPVCVRVCVWGGGGGGCAHVCKCECLAVTHLFPHCPEFLPIPAVMVNIAQNNEHWKKLVKAKEEAEVCMRAYVCVCVRVCVLYPYLHNVFHVWSKYCCLCSCLYRVTSDGLLFYVQYIRLTHTLIC